VLVDALRREPCIVSFSGGRDSSALLALAVAAAREHGLPQPIALTKRYPGNVESDESEWQEAVIRHVGVDDWVRLELDADDYHVLGPVSARLMLAHGPLWPSHLHLQLPLLEAARGGAAITGVGGDEILGGVRFARTAAVLAGRVRPVPRDVLRVGYAAAPRFVKKAFRGRRFREFGSWLRPDARRSVQSSLARLAAAEPHRFDHRLQWWLGLPYLKAAQHNVTLSNPLLDPRVAAALAALPAERRFATRTEAMQLLFGDLLPERILTRRSKASFDHVDAPSRRLELLDRWNGEGVDHELVDADALRREWTRPLTDPSTTPLLQSAWLALTSRRKPAQLVGDLR
jgi:asparagine synthase (glutamine-hydrolysing)